MKGKLNILQKTMLLWNTIHPYNAVHAVRIPQDPDKERLSAVIENQLESNGLTGLIINKAKGSYQYFGGPERPEIRMIQTNGDIYQALSEEIERQLNRGFPDDGAVNPFRFFVLAERESFYLGLVYFHCVAGAESIVFLLKDIVNMYMGKCANSFSHPLDLYPKCYDNLLRTHPNFLLPHIITLPSFIRQMRRSFRPRYRGINNQHNRFTFFVLESDLFHTLVKAGRSWGVTLNDIFLALIMKSLSVPASGRMKASRRRQFAVGSIVNIRKDLKIDSLKTFGLFLGSFIVSHQVSEGISMKDLITDIHKQTSFIKRHKLYLRTPAELFSARILLSFFPPDNRKKFYQKYYPLWGGITNMNLNEYWEQTVDAKPTDYVRAVSTGPVTPLVFSVTTVKDILNIGLTYKTAVFSQQEIEFIIAEFINSVNEI